MSAVTHGLAGYLVNALWQSVLLCAAAWAVSRMVRPLGPTAEHRVWVSALALQCLVPACAVPGLLSLLRHWLDWGGARTGAVTVTMSTAEPLSRGTSAAVLVPVAMSAWALLTLLFAVRLLLQLHLLRRMRRGATTISLEAETARWLLLQQRTRSSARELDVLASTTIQTPVTFGLMRPVLLLPRGFAESVPATEMRAALAHELVHVARHDAAKQLLYRVVTLPLAWHPAVRWTMTQIAETRERVCDHTAAGMTGGAAQYARSLLQLASLLTARRPACAHAIGLFDANQLERRVLMLNRRVFPVARSLRVGLIAGSGVLALAACTSAVALRIDAPSQPSSDAANSTGQNGPVRVDSNIMAGTVISKVQPKYPADAKKAHISGAVVLKAVIGKDGSVQRLQVVSGPKELQASALDAVRQWIYKPYLLNGDPTEVETTITVNYSFAEEPQSQPASGTK